MKQRFPLFDDIVINMSLKVTNDDLEMATSKSYLKLKLLNNESENTINVKIMYIGYYSFFAYMQGYQTVFILESS